MDQRHQQYLEVDRNADSQAPLMHYPKSLRLEPWNLCFNKPSGVLMHAKG